MKSIFWMYQNLYNFNIFFDAQICVLSHVYTWSRVPPIKKLKSGLLWCLYYIQLKK